MKAEGRRQKAEVARGSGGDRRSGLANRIHHSLFIIHHSTFCFLLAFALALTTCGREPKRYNVLLITLDTTRADHLGAYGYKAAETPELDRLAASGLRFEHASSPVPLTLPAHASILSGMLPQHHGLRDNGAGAFPENRETLAKLFSRAGYRTGAFVASFVLDHRFGLTAGFDVYDDEIRRDPNSTSPFEAERPGAEVVDHALGWLGRADGRPFFAWVHLYDAHAPYTPPEPYLSRHKGQPYDGEIAYDDAQVGRLLADLDRRGLRDSTIVAVIGDHGEALGEHGELTHGLLLYEPTLHVPLILSAPAVLRPRVVQTPVSAVDLAPTLAALAGVPFTPSAKIDGHDYSRLLAGGREPEAGDIYAETEYPTIFGWSGLAALRHGGLKLIDAPRQELYDLARDPHETHNILAGERRTFHDLSARLDTMRAGTTTVKPAALDAETKAKLASLGYVAPASSSTPAGPRPDPKDMAPLFRTFEEANWASNENRASDAIAKLRTIVVQDPQNPVFRGSLARALRQQGHLEEAIRLYQESVGIAPGDPEAWYNLSVALQEAGRAKEAGIAIREAIRRDPTRPEAHNALGIVFTTERNLEAAHTEFRKAIAIDPHDARAFNNLGNVYRATGRLDEAAAAYEKALALAPAYADALNGLGVIEVQRDRPREAIPRFDRAIALAPRFYEAQLNRGIALQLAGDRSAAEAQFRSLLANLPSGPAYKSQRAAASQLLGSLGRQSD